MGDPNDNDHIWAPFHPARFLASLTIAYAIENIVTQLPLDNSHRLVFAVMLDSGSRVLENAVRRRLSSPALVKAVIGAQNTSTVSTRSLRIVKPQLSCFAKRLSFGIGRSNLRKLEFQLLLTMVEQRTRCHREVSLAPF
ncbi:hypothetical protein HFN60_07205 [Rhizobium leguminosarum]|uniref:hypothetical protein n=1 Tax=Rhizobium leguminosarum TaxID=384 RepID=UPI001C962C64|nr:hypothetical protein [Rhizobium leguminosarum]MBY5815438.1 hypothetical protein [Rhizobium leguminosarum]